MTYYPMWTTTATDTCSGYADYRRYGSLFDSIGKEEEKEIVIAEVTVEGKLR